MFTTPPTSLEPSGGSYCTYSPAPTGAGPPMGESSAPIGQRALLDDPASGLPVAPAVQPSLDAAEPSGLTHDTWIHVPARAAGTATSIAHTSRAAAQSARTERAVVAVTMVSSSAVSP
ncbi:MAG TPA: hypothetical protein VGG07_00055 [Solirubrobacteraceae bacterium]